MSTLNETAHDLKKAEGDAIGSAEKDSASGVLGGAGHSLHGALESAAGKVEAGLGHALNNPEMEAKGLGKQVEGGIEKAAGGVEEGVSKEAFKGAVKADAEYVKH